MVSKVLETVLLREAVRRGLLTATELASEPEPAEAESLTPPVVRFGPRLDRLVHRGRISAHDVLALIAEAQAAQTLDGAPVASARLEASAGLLGAASGDPTLDGNPSIGSHQEPELLNPEPTLDGAGAPRVAVTLSVAYPVADWPRYEFLGLLGQGGMGAVYKARDKRLGRIVALKFIRGGDLNLAIRFLQEARAQARVDHPGVCKVYEVGEVAGKAFIAMQFVDGKTLDKLGSTLSLTEKVLIVIDVAEAIHSAHKLGIIHRDLKPSNVMVERTEDGRWRPVVMDFGLAREAGENRGLTESGAVMGTPSYMSPEQARGEARSLDRRTDVYSLGATLYELVGGSPPFDDTTVVQVLLKVMNEDPPPLRSRLPAIPVDLETIILKCLNKEPSQRYSTALALAEDLHRHVKAERIVGRRASLASRLRRLAARNRMLVAVSALSLVVILGLAGYGVRTKVRAERERTRLAAQAQLAQRLGQDVKDIEWLLRSAYQLPLHDIGREQLVIRQRMAELQARRHGLDPADVGFIHYALGRGYLALHELEAAYQELLRAQQKGVELAEMHYALGRVLGELYKKQLAQARRSGEKDWLANRQKQLEKQYLEPALVSLERSRSAKLESSQFLDGLIALYRRQYDDAIKKAQRSAAESPWLYEALQLEGDVYLEQAAEQRDHGEYQQAEQSLLLARKVYQRAADIGRSDASIYNAIAETWILKSRLDIFQNRPPIEALSEAISACEKSHISTPNDAAAYTNSAYSYFWLAWNQIRNGKDPLGSINQLITQGNTAIKLNPNDEYAYDAIGNGYLAQGNYERNVGQNPEESWRKAEEYLQKAIQLAPSFPWAFNDLGLVYLERGRYLDDTGKDATTAHLQAINYFTKSIDIYPSDSSVRTNLIIEYAILARNNYLHGKNPKKFTESAVRESQNEIFKNEKLQLVYLYTASAKIYYAQYLLDAGEDPSEPMLEAQESIAKLLRNNSSDPLFLYWNVNALLVLARHKIHRGIDPSADINNGHIAVLSILKPDPADQDGLVAEAQLHLLAAQWAMKQGAQEMPLLQSALSAARRAHAVPSQNTNAVEQLARVTWKLAEATRPQPSPTQLAEGLSLVELALQRNPDLAHGYAIRGALLLLKAVQAPTQQERLAIARQAEESFAQAVTVNPLLRNEYGPYIAHVKDLLSQQTSDNTR